MTASEDCAERLLDLAKHVLDIRPLSRVRPHIFEEQKQEAARRIREIASEMRTIGRLPVRTATRFQTGTIAGPTGRFVRVERRQRKAA